MTGDRSLLSHLVDPDHRESGLRLDREGRWHHEGEPVTHMGLAKALHGWIDRDLETGRYVLRAGAEWCFVEVEDSPLFVRGVSIEGEGCDRRVWLRLSDGSEEELAYGTLRQAEDNVLYCDARQGSLTARFDRAPYHTLGETVELEGDRALLPAAGRRWPIAHFCRR